MTSAPSPKRVVRIAVLGCGTVGSALIGILQDRADSLAVQCGARLEVGGIAVSDLSVARAPHIPVPLLTDDARKLVADPTVDVEAGVIGGADLAAALARNALEPAK